MTQIELFSPLPPAECAARLSEAIDNRYFCWPIIRSSESHLVVGRVDQSSLRLRKRIQYRNQLQPLLSATMRTENQGTLISGEFAVHPAIRLLMYFSLGIFSLIGCISAVAFFAGRLGAGRYAWFGAVEPWITFAFVWSVYRFCRWLARDEQEFLTRFVMRVLDAEPRAAADPYEAIAG